MPVFKMQSDEDDAFEVAAYRVNTMEAYERVEMQEYA